MDHCWRLVSRIPGDLSLHLTWNSKTGDLGGTGAARIATLIAYHEFVGTIPIVPLPAVISATDVRRSYEQMAAVLHQGWFLPDELAKHYPRLPDGVEAATGVVLERVEDR